MELNDERILPPQMKSRCFLPRQNYVIILNIEIQCLCLIIMGMLGFVWYIQLSKKNAVMVFLHH